MGVGSVLFADLVMLVLDVDDGAGVVRGLHDQLGQLGREVHLRTVALAGGRQNPLHRLEQSPEIDTK